MNLMTMVGTRHILQGTRGSGETCSPLVSRGTRSLVRSRRINALQSRVTSCSATGYDGASERVVLGESDLSVSRCCLGTMTWGQQNTEAEAHEQLDFAFENGINFVDTAEIYPVPPVKETQGLTDRYIGSWLAGRQNRDKIVLATKVSGYGRQSYLRKDGSTPRVNEKNIVESVDASLQRLGVDHVDLLQVHWPDRYVPLFGAASYDASLERPDDVPFEEQLRGLEKVIQAGKVRYIGVSNETSYGVMKFSQLAESMGLPKIQTIQNSYSLISRSLFETDLAEVCAPRQCNVSLLAYSPLAGGALTGKYVTDDESKIANSRFTLFEGYMKRYQQSIGREAVAEYCNVAKRHDLTPTELALAWCHSRWFVASTIIGATTMAQLKENLASFDVTLSDECIHDIGLVYKRYRDPSFN
jgi:aryl-alcohol dehydrogenase-like predicted oxidoreductase